MNGLENLSLFVILSVLMDLHPNVFAPQEELPHDEFTSIEDINNYLLEHKEVVDYIRKRGKGGKALFLMFDEKTEELAKKNGLEVCFPPAKAEKLYG